MFFNLGKSKKDEGNKNSQVNVDLEIITKMNQEFAISLDLNDFKAVGDFTIQQDIDLVVVGPEQPLVDGIHDYFQSQPMLFQY